MSNGYELADVLRSYLPGIDRESVPMDHYRTLDAISKCRTAALGGHVDACDSCGHMRISYNSCRNRHCPKCQGLNKEMWLVMQEDMLLPVVYYHIVFTLPHELNLLCMYHPEELYDLLFKSVWHTLKTLSLDEQWLGAQSAATMVLHTWSQTLQLHPHLHCIVPNGGLTKEGDWRFPKRGKDNFLYPVKAMQKIFKGYFMAHLVKGIKQGKITIPAGYYESTGGDYYGWKDTLYRKDWVVYTKKPFSGVKHVIDYLGRYSHRVAITNRRIMDIDETSGVVSFEYKDYKDKAKKKEMTLSISEFVRRFSLHILPKGFRKIRQFGFTSNAAKGKKIGQARSSLGVYHQGLMDKAGRKSAAMVRLKISFDSCAKCKSKKLRRIITITSTRPPPDEILEKIAKQNMKSKVGG